jgi:ABC-type dipeptide/oligopeptide/nickel transport system permease component
MLRFVLHRLVLLLPSLFLLTLVTFVLGAMAPGDPVEILLGQHANPEAATRLRRELGLDRPLPAQFAAYVTGALRGDFGVSYYDRRPVAETLARGFPATMQLGLAAILLAVAIGVPLGVLAAAWGGTRVDRTAMGLALLGTSVPTFVIGPLLIAVFAMRLGWVPVAQWREPTDVLLPALTLGIRPAAMIARITRASMLEALGQDYIRTALAKGLSRTRVLLLHGLRNAFLPTLTVIGTSAGYLMGGSFVVETIFRVPGIGALSIEAIQRRDYPTIQAATLLLAVCFVLIHLIVDIAYGFLDPRVRQGREAVAHG